MGTMERAGRQTNLCKGSRGDMAGIHGTSVTRRFRGDAIDKEARIGNRQMPI